MKKMIIASSLLALAMAAATPAFAEGCDTCGYGYDHGGGVKFSVESGAVATGQNTRASTAGYGYLEGPGFDGGVKYDASAYGPGESAVGGGYEMKAQWYNFGKGY